MRHHEALFDNGAFQFVAPHRQAGFQTEFTQVFGRFQLENASSFLTAQLIPFSIGKLHVFHQIVEHHDPAERSRQRGHQISVVAPRDYSEQCSRRIATQAISQQPFGAEPGFRLRGSASRPLHANNGFPHSALRVFNTTAA